MADWTITFDITRQEMRRTDINKVVGDSENHLYAVFTFSEEWATISKIAQFTRHGITYNVEIVNGQCLVPKEALIGEGIFELTVFGTDTGMRTVNPCTVTVYASGIKPGQLPSEPTPGLFDSVFTARNETLTARDAAAEHASAAETSETNAKGYAESAQTSKESAASSETNAQGYASAAQGYSGAAEGSAAAAAEDAAELSAMYGDLVAALDAINGEVA